jgi:hypothetical protein
MTDMNYAYSGKGAVEAQGRMVRGDEKVVKLLHQRGDGEPDIGTNQDLSSFNRQTFPKDTVCCSNFKRLILFVKTLENKLRNEF